MIDEAKFIPIQKLREEIEHVETDAKNQTDLLREDLEQSLVTIALQAPIGEEQEYAHYLYWHCPEILVKSLSLVFGVPVHEFHKYVGEAAVGECNRCKQSITFKSRESARMGYRTCTTCAQEAAATRQAERDEEARRLNELRAMPYRDYLQTPEWKRKAADHRKRGGYRCQVCNSNQDRLNIHHRTYERLGREQVSDLVCLCENCHHLFHQNGKLAPHDH